MILSCFTPIPFNIHVAGSSTIVNVLEDSNFAVNMHWEALVRRLGLSQDSIVGLRQNSGTNSDRLAEGIERVLHQRQLTWSVIDEEVKVIQPTVNIMEAVKRLPILL